MAKNPYIPVAPKKPKSPAPSPGGTGGGAPSGGGGGSGGSGGGGGGGGGSDPYASYLRKQKAAERKASRKAANRYIDQAETLGLQAKALRVALGKKGFRRELRIKLGNVRRSYNQQEDLLISDYQTRLDNLEDSAEENEKAAGAQSYANKTNRAREQTNAVSEASNMGAGESDRLRAQAMSLRNWQQNQQEINRSFFDTRTSINSSLDDLTTDTRTARVTNALQANADKDQLWTTYYDQKSESLTNLGNTYGQMSEYFGFANEEVGSKKTRKRMRNTAKRSGKAFEKAARLTGRADRNRGIPKRIRDWQGAADFDGSLNNSVFSGSATELADHKTPSGASLRKW